MSFLRGGGCLPNAQHFSFHLFIGPLGNQKDKQSFDWGTMV